MINTFYFVLVIAGSTLSESRFFFIFSVLGFETYCHTHWASCVIKSVLRDILWAVLTLSTYPLSVTSRKVSSSNQTVAIAEKAAEARSGFLYYFWGRCTVHLRLAGKLRRDYSGFVYSSSVCLAQINIHKKGTKKAQVMTTKDRNEKNRRLIRWYVNSLTLLCNFLEALWVRMLALPLSFGQKI